MQHKKESGFTLVELSIVLVIIGIILGAVLQGQELINNSKAKRITSDIKGFEAMLWSYYDRKGHWPGDCNIDGLIGYAPTNAAAPDATDDALSNNTNADADNCDYSAGTPDGDQQNAPFSDLRIARISTPDTPNVSLSRHINNGSYRIGDGTWVDPADATNTLTVPTLITYNIPAWMAKMIDVSMDGTESGTTGRIRNWTTNDNGTAWPADSANDTVVSIAYYFDTPIP